MIAAEKPLDKSDLGNGLIEALTVLEILNVCMGVFKMYWNGGAWGNSTVGCVFI